MRYRLLLGLLGLFLFSGACSTSNKARTIYNPLAQLQQALAASKEYSIVLQDMKTEGNFVDEFYHQYKLIAAQKVTGQEEVTFSENTTDWLRVDESVYQTYENALGMVVASKDADGKVSNVAQPPGYQYVGNTQYGQWRTNNDGSRFWEFYGKYALISSMFNMFSGPVYYRDYSGYRDYYRTGRPYYGTNNQWGTRGTYAKKTHPTFFQRKQQRASTSKNRFANKVRSRTSSSRTSRSNMSKVRGRSSSSRGGK